MKLLIVNNSSDTFTYAEGSVVIQPNSTLDVSPSVWFALCTDTDFIKDIRLSNVFVNDGVTTYQTSAAEDYLKYINDSNNYNNRDTDGALITRNKAAKKGWSFWAIALECTTSTLQGTLYCKDSSDIDIPGVFCKIYDANDAEVTTAGILNANLNNCVKTVVDFEMPFDFEIIGGTMRVNANQSQDVRMWIIGAPDIPASGGGSKEFASGINLKFLAQDSSFEIDGRVTKFITYDPTYHSGKIRMLFRHPAGTQANAQVVIHLYRQ